MMGSLNFPCMTLNREQVLKQSDILLILVDYDEFKGLISKR